MRRTPMMTRAWILALLCLFGAGAAGWLGARFVLFFPFLASMFGVVHGGLGAIAAVAVARRRAR